MKLCDARSYFSGSTELILQEPGELARQLQAHACEEPYVREALLELHAFGAMMVAARRLTPAARTLAGAYALELLWDAGEAGLDFEELLAALRRRHKMSGRSRNARVLLTLWTSGAIEKVEYHGRVLAGRLAEIRRLHERELEALAQARDDERRAVEGDEQRDYAEERAQAAAAREEAEAEREDELREELETLDELEAEARRRDTFQAPEARFPTELRS